MGFLFVGLLASLASLARAAAPERAELYRQFCGTIGEDTANSTEHFRALFDDNVVFVIHRGEITADDESRGIENLVRRGSNWYRKGLDAKSRIVSYVESGDGTTAFITGTYEFTWSERKEYAWSAQAHWVGQRIVRYELFSEFSHQDWQFATYAQEAPKVVGELGDADVSDVE